MGACEGLVNGVGTAEVAIACCSMPDYCDGIAIGLTLRRPGSG